MTAFGAGQSFSGSSKLCKPEERQDNHDDHNYSNDVDDVVHEGHLSTWTGLRYEGATNTRYCTFARNSIRNRQRPRSRRNLGLMPGQRATDSFSLNVSPRDFGQSRQPGSKAASQSQGGALSFLDHRLIAVCHRLVVLATRYRSRAIHS